MRSRAGVSSAAVDQIDVETSVAVVVEQRDAAAARFQDVVLRRPAAVGPRRKPCGLLERHGRRRTRRRAMERPAPVPCRTRALRTRAPWVWSGCSCPGSSCRGRLLPRAGRARVRAAPGTDRCRRDVASPAGTPRGDRRPRGAAPSAARARAAPHLRRRTLHGDRARRPALRAAGRHRVAHAARHRSAHPAVRPVSGGLPPHAEARGAAPGWEPPPAPATWPLRPHTAPGKRRPRPHRISAGRDEPSAGPLETQWLHSGPDSPIAEGPAVLLERSSQRRLPRNDFDVSEIATGRVPDP